MITRWPAARVDLALAAALAVAEVVIAWLIDAGMNPGTPLDLWGMSLIAVSALALAVHRHWPIVAVAVAAGVTTLYLLLGYSYGPIMVGLFIAVYGLARYSPPRQSALVASIVLLVLLTHLLRNKQSLGGAIGIVPGSAWVVVPYAAGLSVRLMRQAREDERARHVADERMRLAQDVHDVVGHNLAAIKMQADIALHVMRKNPEKAEAALIAISGSSGEALGELRTALAELKDHGSRSPTPGLARLDEVRIIVLTTFALDEYVFDALRYGASGFLVKDTSPADLVGAIRLVAGGVALLSPEVTRSVVREFVTGTRRPLTPHPHLDTLTTREREIVTLVAEGLSNDEIAERLVISPATARTHVSRSMVKLNARDRAQLVVFAFQSGLAG